MEFGEDNFKTLLPSYLSSTDKDRLKTFLNQFSIGRGNQQVSSSSIDYSNFTTTVQVSYFKQSDLLRDIRFPFLDDDYNFVKKYTNAIVLSNTCDISNDNKHSHNEKECLLAPLVKLTDFTTDQSVIHEIKSQKISNLFYIFTIEEEYVACLDKAFNFPTKELNEYLRQEDIGKICSLTLFGYYLFLTKLTYHFSRFPEEKDREI